ncbi:hypothetical protein BST61_g1251 [Cercospora zeina]
MCAVPPTRTEITIQTLHLPSCARKITTCIPVVARSSRNIVNAISGLGRTLNAALSRRSGSKTLCRCARST